MVKRRDGGKDGRTTYSVTSIRGTRRSSRSSTSSRTSWSTIRVSTGRVRRRRAASTSSRSSTTRSSCTTGGVHRCVQRLKAARAACALRGWRGTIPTAECEVARGLHGGIIRARALARATDSSRARGERSPRARVQRRLPRCSDRRRSATRSLARCCLSRRDGLCLLPPRSALLLCCITPLTADGGVPRRGRARAIVRRAAGVVWI